MALLSVKEYAAKHGQDGGRVRLLIAQSRIPAEKIGAQWAIDEDTPWPADQRVKSGAYRNWRKKRENHSEA